MGMVSQIVTIIFTFITRNLFIKYIGVELLGINSTFASVLGTLSLAELGFQTAITYSLYRPLHDDNKNEINDIMSIFSFVNPNIYIEKIIVLLFGCFALALGVYLQVIANVIINPGEGVVKAIANKTGKKFGNIKIMFDSTLCIIAIVISLFTFGKIKGVREGTIICAVLVGNITKIYSFIFEHFKYKKTKYETENYESSQSI